MKAARLLEHTHDLSDALVLQDVEKPTLSRSNDVIIEVRGASWCGTDNKIIKGLRDVDLPLTMGHENAGIVHEVAEEVTSVSVGDPVVCLTKVTCGKCRACRTGNEVFCPERYTPGTKANGGYAEYMVTSERNLVVLESLDPVDAPPIPAGLVTYNAAKQAAPKLHPGSFALVVGIGGIGHIGLQAVNLLGQAETIAVDLRAEACELAERFGADYTINPAEEDVPEAVREITDGEGVAQVVDFVGATQTLGWGPDVLVPNGDHLVVGYAGDLNVPAQKVALNGIAYKGTRSGTYAEFQDLTALVEAGEIEPVTTTFDLEEINEVAQRVEQGDILGRAVLVP